LDDVRPALMPTRLPFYYGALSPLGRLPYSTAVRVWWLLMTACALLCILVHPSNSRLAFAAAMSSSPLLMTLVSGQDDALLCLIVVGGLHLRQRGKLVAAGAVMSLLAIKFHLFLLLPIAFLITREFAVLLGMMLGGAGLLVSSFFAGGWNWPVKYVELLLTPVINPAASLMPNLHSVLWAFPKFELAATLVFAAVVLLVARKFPGEAVAITLLGSFLISFHAYAGDILVLLPILFAALQSQRSAVAIFCISSLSAAICLLGFGFITAAALAGVLIELVFSAPQHVQGNPAPPDNAAIASAT
jgi:hypothetical protein